jgi:1-acyl-sn-glycerol-3-phosphate acyltransferase
MNPATTDGHPVVRRVLTGVCKGLFRALTSTTVRGLEHLPVRGPAILAGNHLGPIDPALAMAYMPWPVETLALTDLFQVAGTGTLLRLYGVIPVDRDAHDGGAMVLAVEALNRGRVIGILPEGRVSVTGSLERARTGVAYLALTSGAPVLPCAVTGTERALEELARLRRPRLTLTIGAPVRFGPETLTSPRRRERLREVADEIMYRIAELLPPQYRGVYGVTPPAGSSTARHSAPDAALAERADAALS